MPKSFLISESLRKKEEQNMSIEFFFQMGDLSRNLGDLSQLDFVLVNVFL